MIELRPKGTTPPALSIAHSITGSQHFDPPVPDPVMAQTPAPPPTAPAPEDVSTTTATSAQPDVTATIAAAHPSTTSTVLVPPALKTPGVAKPARKDSEGDRSLVRVFGLKLGKVVIDAGHGGHDTGTIGPNGLMEKDLVLDVALRLGKLVSQQLGATVVYTRADDTFIPLEERTRIANNEKADLFISIHANSSPEPTATGIETYFFNLHADKVGLDLATRENATAGSAISDLNDLLHKAVLQTKLEESREFAQKVQTTLWANSTKMNNRSRDRGVRSAPFVVLIGATMPSILTEIGFVSNPHDAKFLSRSDQRERIAQALFKGIAQYADSLSHVQMAKSE
jgi:N-acetylmuramoyl-L-alanine amidase